MKRLLILLIACIAATGMSAQPAKRRTGTTVQPAGAKTTVNTEKKADRAALMFPTSEAMPEDVVWRRDIYRQLDLTKDANAPLYYPVEPRGKEQNLFTYLFRLMLSGRISVYEYKIDGNESFEEADRIKPEQIGDLLNRYHINFEESSPGKITVMPVDIPSAQVKRFDVKETSYFDQRSATYKSRVTALCPVLMDEFSTESVGTSYPLFWVKYDDVAPYLSRVPLMASNLNNVTNMTVDDYFTLNRYEGKIYKTNNLQGKVLANYCPTDSAMNTEQKRIEQQLKDFEKNIWGHEEQVDSLDSIQGGTLDDAGKKVSRRRSSDSKESKKEAKSSRRSSGSEAKAPKAPKSSSGPRVSARRQRR